MAARPLRPLLLIDIAVPRDIDPAAKTVPGVHLFDVDDLRSTLDEALAARQAEVPRVEAILDEETAVLQKELRALAIRPLIADLHQQAEQIRQRELARSMKYLRDLDPQTIDHIQHLTRSLVTKLLHEPTRQLRTHAGNGTAVEYAGTVRELFGLAGES
jgi:glutamyl-tRNA reductase